MLWHVEDTIVVLKESLGPHPWCDNYNMFLTQEAMTEGHIGVTM